MPKIFYLPLKEDNVRRCHIFCFVAAFMCQPYFPITMLGCVGPMRENALKAHA